MQSVTFCHPRVGGDLKQKIPACAGMTTIKVGGLQKIYTSHNLWQETSQAKLLLQLISPFFVFSVNIGGEVGLFAFFIHPACPIN